MTEFGGATHVAPDDGPDRPESVGPPLPGVECRIIDHDTGTDVAPGRAGELLIRSPSAMRGYLNDPAATAATIDADGWLHTGDIVTVDSHGWYRVTDRIKELIKPNGYQVAPAELENVLLAHPAVADVAVVRSPDRTAGEVPKAFVVLRTAATPEDLTTWVAERVAPHEQVRRIEFIDEIPRSAAGKILRRTLVERAHRTRTHALTRSQESPKWGISDPRTAPRPRQRRFDLFHLVVALIGFGRRQPASAGERCRAIGNLALTCTQPVQAQQHRGEVSLRGWRERHGHV